MTLYEMSATINWLISLLHFLYFYNTILYHFCTNTHSVYFCYCYETKLFLSCMHYRFLTHYLGPINWGLSVRLSVSPLCLTNQGEGGYSKKALIINFFLEELNLSLRALYINSRDLCNYVNIVTSREKIIQIIKISKFPKLSISA